MKRNGVSIIVSVLVLVGLIAIGFGCTPQETKTPAPTTSAPATTAAPAPSFPEMKLRLGSPMGGPPAVDAEAAMLFEKIVTEGSGGKITFENFWGGSLFSSGEALDAVAKGVTDIAHLSAGWAPGKLPIRNFEHAFPFRPTDTRIYTEIMREMEDTVPAFKKEYSTNNIKSLFLTPSAGGYGIHSKSPIKTIADMKGKKIAVIGTYFPKWVADADAVPVTMTVVDRYTALERGTIDAHIMLINWICNFKQYEVAKNYTHATIGSLCAGGFVINLEKWNSFSPEVQKLFTDAGKEAEEWQVKTYEAELPKYVETMEKAGVTFYTMPVTEEKKWADLMPDYPALWAEDMEKQGLAGWEVVDAYLKLCEQAGHKWPRQWGVR